MNNYDLLISMKDITRMTTLASPTIYRLIRDQKFPPGEMITINRRVWRLSEVEEAINRLLDEQK